MQRKSNLTWKLTILLNIKRSIFLEGTYTEYVWTRVRGHHSTEIPSVQLKANKCELKLGRRDKKQKKEPMK